MEQTANQGTSMTVKSSSGLPSANIRDETPLIIAEPARILEEIPKKDISTPGTAMMAHRIGTSNYSDGVGHSRSFHEQP